MTDAYAFIEFSSSQSFCEITATVLTCVELRACYTTVVRFISARDPTGYSFHRHSKHTSHPTLALQSPAPVTPPPPL